MTPDNFKFDPPLHPTKNTQPVGTLETMKGVALFEKKPDGTFCYNGETEIWWDEQRTISEKGRHRGRDVLLVKLVDEGGDEWWAELIEVKGAPGTPETKPA